MTFQYATYNGNRQEMLGQFVGPNTLGEYYIVTDCEYDEGAGRSRVEFDWLGDVTRLEGPE